MQLICNSFLVCVLLARWVFCGKNSFIFISLDGAKIVQFCSVCVCLESRYKRQTHVIQADFTEGHSIYSAIEQQLEGLQIGILGKIKIKNEV